MMERIIRWLIKKWLPEYHLRKNPKKPIKVVEGIVIPDNYFEVGRIGSLKGGENVK